MQKVLLAISMICFTASCTPQDRCGSEYDYVNGICILIDTDSDTETDSDTGPEPDGGDTDVSSGIGEACTPDGNECAGYQADYCLAQPGSDEGYCTFDDCAPSPAICPSGYDCCDIGSSSFCANDEDFSMLTGLGLCQE